MYLVDSHVTFDNFPLILQTLIAFAQPHASLLVRTLLIGLHLQSEKHGWVSVRPRHVLDAMLKLHGKLATLGADGVLTSCSTFIMIVELMCCVAMQRTRVTRRPRNWNQSLPLQRLLVATMHELRFHGSCGRWGGPT